METNKVKVVGRSPHVEVHDQTVVWFDLGDERVSVRVTAEGVLTVRGEQPLSIEPISRNTIDISIKEQG